nr:hypothetical protein [Treponema sp.]
IDFLIPSSYIVSGIYLNIPNDKKNIIYNRETLPHIHLGEFLEKKFLCKAIYDAGVVLVMDMKDFAKDVCVDIYNYTETAFPYSGYLAISVNSDITSKELSFRDLHLLPKSIRDRMYSCGICATHFIDVDEKQKSKQQLLISPDMILRRFFTEVGK